MAYPKHVAIIMDGNGRWAEGRSRPRTFGHIKGARVAKNVIEWAAERKLSHLTLYAFSTENWNRPEAEISFLFFLMRRHLRRERKTLVQNNIRFQAIGQLDRLPPHVREEIKLTENATARCTGMVLTSALSYGSRQEITAAMKHIAAMVETGDLKSTDINESIVQSVLLTHDMPDPDLIIRTSGEFRLSNFFLWQAAYSELYVSPLHWPDFDEAAFEDALRSYSKRERRFGMISQQIRRSETGLADGI